MRDNIMTPNDDEICKLTEMLEIQQDDEDIEFINEDMVLDDGDDESLEIMEDYDEDEAIKTFSKHGAPVFGLDLNLKYNLVASGDQLDKALIWDFRTDQVFVEVNLKDTVIHVAFSYDANYLTIGDMAGNIVVYKISQVLNEPVHNNVTSITSFIGMTPSTSTSISNGTATAPSTSNGTATVPATGNQNVNDQVDHEASAMAGLSFEQVFRESVGDVEWVTWHFGVNVLFAGTKGTGEIYMWNIPTGECKIMPGVGCSAELGGVTHDGKKIACVYENGMMKLWDAKSCQAISTHFNNDDTNLKEPRALAVSKDTPIFAAGDKDGKIFFYTYNGFVGQVQAHGSVECLYFPPVSCGLKVCISCTLGGQIAVWDYSRMQIRNTIENPQNISITSMVMMTDCLFAVGTVQGIIHIYDVRKEEPLQTMLGHLSTIYKLVYDYNNKLIYSTSEDYSVRIFKPEAQITSVV